MSKIVFTLHKTMDRLGLGQRQLSRLSGVREATINTIYNQNTLRFELSTLQAILDALNAYDTTKDYTIDDIMIYKKDEE